MFSVFLPAFWLSRKKDIGPGRFQQVVVPLNARHAIRVYLCSSAVPKSLTTCRIERAPHSP
jgi:hypothetical protein